LAVDSSDCCRGDSFRMGAMGDEAMTLEEKVMDIDELIDAIRKYDVAAKKLEKQLRNGQIDLVIRLDKALAKNIELEKLNELLEERRAILDRLAAEQRVEIFYLNAKLRKLK